MKSQSRTDRDALGFAESVQRHFKFLKLHGFQVVHYEPTFVRYESSLFFINLYHGRRSFEIGLELGRIAIPEDEAQPYPMSALLEVVGFSDAKNYRNYAARTLQTVDAGVAKLSKLFREQLSDDLLRRHNLFSALKHQRNARGEALALETSLEQARRVLETAWHIKDYKKVVKTLLPLYNHLTPAERKKLEYAKRMILH